jgi:hypothetical protein
MTTIAMIQGLQLWETGAGGGGVLFASGMDLLDRITDEGNGHAKHQHNDHGEANAQSQTELDIPKYHTGSCHAVATDHAITLFDLVFCHVAGDDSRDGSDKGYEKPCSNSRYQADNCQGAGGLGRGKWGILLIHLFLL